MPNNIGLSEGKLFTIEALNRIEGFVWPEKAKFAAFDRDDVYVTFFGDGVLHYDDAAWIGKRLVSSSVNVGSARIDWRNSLITKAEFDSVDGWVRVTNGCNGCGILHGDTAVDVKYFLDGDGFQSGSLAKFINWGDVKLWRYHKPTKETTMPAKSIEDIIHQYKAQKETSADAQKALDASKEVEDALLEKIKSWSLSHGFDIRLLDESDEKRELVVTDWRDLRVGDVIYWGGWYWGSAW